MTALVLLNACGVALVGAQTTSTAATLSPTSSASATPAAHGPKIAFIGDQGLGSNAVAVLTLIKNEGADAIIHSGDFDYKHNPTAWDAQISGVLGPAFPYFAAVGNHDERDWKGPKGYQQFLINRMNKLGLKWEGDLGVRSAFHFKRVYILSTAPGLKAIRQTDSHLFIRDRLAADKSTWSIAHWHKNMQPMQPGGKSDDTGWEVYEESRAGGAIIATAHEHSYARTHLLSGMKSRTVASTSNTLTISKGLTFAFVSGLGGKSIRDQESGGGWWAKIYASICLPGDDACQPNAAPGALFGVFEADGVPNKASFYFKDIHGRVIDTFTVISNVEPVVTTSTGDARH